MRPAFPASLLAAIAFIAWAHTNTDEVPIVLGIILILSSVLSGFFLHPVLVGFLTGIPVFIVELLVHFRLMGAHWAPSAGIPWAALVAFVPAYGGAFFGAAVRKLN